MCANPQCNIEIIRAITIENDNNNNGSELNRRGGGGNQVVYKCLSRRTKDKCRMFNNNDKKEKE